MACIWCEKEMGRCMKAIFFDLDQTLVNRTGTFASYLKKAYRDLQFEQRGVTEQKFTDQVHQWDDNGYRDKQEAFSLVYKHLKLKASSSEMFAHFKQFYGQDAQLFPNVFPFLETLAQNYPLALISNGRHEGQMTKLKVTGIKPFFKAILISESHGAKKPEPSIYLAACEQLNVQPADVMFVGDHPKNDVEQPKALGMKAVWIRNDVYSPPEQYDAIVDDVVDINQYF
jgi:putative hydrolase of the HAD superfamily